MLGDAVPLAVLLDEPLVDECADALANPAGRRAAEVRARQPDGLGELVDASIRVVAQRPEQVLVEIHTGSVAERGENGLNGPLTSGDCRRLRDLRRSSPHD